MRMHVRHSACAICACGVLGAYRLSGRRDFILIASAEIKSGDRGRDGNAADRRTPHLSRMHIR